MKTKSLPEAGPPGVDAGALDEARLHAARARLRRYARLLDSGVGIPGTRWRIGIESLIGLIPGIGDLAGAALGSWFIVEAVRLRVPGALLARMIGNVAFDTLLGVVPVVGDVADFVFKSNHRNLRMLDGHLDARLGAAPARAHRRGPGVLALLLIVVIAALVWLAATHA